MKLPHFYLSNYSPALLAQKLRFRLLIRNVIETPYKSSHKQPGFCSINFLRIWITFVVLKSNIDEESFLSD